MKPLSRLRGEHAVLVGSVVAMFSAALFLAQKPRGLGHDPKNEKQGSTHYPSPLGGKACYALLESLGLSPFRHERALELLPSETRALLMLGTTSTPEESELDWLKGWVSRGGTLIWCPRRDHWLATIRISLVSSRLRRDHSCRNSEIMRWNRSSPFRHGFRT